MPAFNPASAHQNGSYSNYNQSQGTISRDDSLYNYPPPQQGMYDDDNDSTVHLATSAAPFGQQSQISIDRPGTAPPPIHMVQCL